MNGFGDTNNDECISMGVYNNYLYVGTERNEAATMTGCEVWRTAGVGGPPFADWMQVNTDGFGDKDNNTAIAMTVYDGNLYVGSGGDNIAMGCGVWKTAGAGGPPFNDWVQVIPPGFGDTNNRMVASMVVYNNLLYVGTYNEYSGTEIWKNLANTAMPWIPLLLLDD